jgi:hypothetical protein
MKLRQENSGALPFATLTDTSRTAAPVFLDGAIGPAFGLCSADYDEPTPCVLTIGIHGAGGVAPTINGVDGLEYPAGQNTEDGFDLGGLVEVFYGSGAAVQRIVFDLRPGTYQLPPCTQVRANVLAYYDGANGGFGTAITVQGNIAAGHCGTAGSQPTFTIPVTLLANTSVQLLVPCKARYVDLFCGNVTAIGTGKPVVKLYSVNNTGFPSLVRDYVLGVWSPPYEARCMNYGVSTTVTLISTVACGAFVLFVLEF